jgi:hypothetical protein
MSDVTVEALEIHASWAEFLPKPYTDEQLSGAINTLLRKKA